MKAKVTTLRGTSSKEIEVGSLAFAGEEFISYQKRRMEGLPKKLAITLGKGTGKMEVVDYPKERVKNPFIGPKVLSTQRGTSIRHL